jgi:hypothetical protein
MNKKIKIIITSSFLIGTAFSLSSCVALSDFLLGVQDYDRYCVMKENTNLPGFIDFLSKNSNSIYLTYRPPLSERDKKFIDKNNEISAILSSITNYPETSSYNYELHTIDNDNRIADIIGNIIYPKSIGTFTIYSSCKGSNYQRYEIVIVDRSQDPYTNIDSKNFYKYYSPVNSNMDAYYRSLHGYMSGELITPDQAPIIDANRPKLDDKYIRNSSYSIDDSTYVVKDKSGKEIYKIYKDGGYITLEEVAAYIFAFGDVPANYYESPYDGVTPTNSPWGEYLRLNNQYFADDTSTFKYEPSLPNAGSSYYEGLAYFEVDIGTTGTDCDPNYGASLYNDGTRIARGAARIVYTRYKDKSPITNLDDRYVFYTYNHYNDFQEYLNYYNGWGEMFGNITGGGTISSNVDYNPTPYVESSKSKLFA